jgi:hypothetical protein
MNEVTREEDLDDEAFQIKQVFTTFGLASYHGQVLQRGLANVLTVARTDSESGTQDDFDSFMVEHLAATMGRLIKLPVSPSRGRPAGGSRSSPVDAKSTDASLLQGMS